MLNHLFDSLIPAGRAPGQICLETADRRRFTYGDLDRLSARYAQALTRCGVRKGDRVALQAEKSPEALFLYLGCLRAGAAFLPLNTAYTLAEIEYFVGDAEPALFVGPPEQRAELHAMLAIGGRRAGGNAWSRRPAAPWLTSPKPKPANGRTRNAHQETWRRSSTHQARRDARRAPCSATEISAQMPRLWCEAWRFTADDVLIHALPIFHTHGLFVATNVTLMAGASMIFLPRFDAQEVLALMARATVLMGVPTFYTRLLAQPALTAETTASIRLFISGSAPLLADTHHRFRERTGHAILERYGMTETSMITSNPYLGERVPGSVGFPLRGVEIRIADPETGQALGPNEIGMIEVKGPNVFSGYWRMPDKTMSEFRSDSFFVTGDLGKIDERGYLWILGRGKDLVISGGYNVYPKEIELEIDALPGIEESAVIGVPHPDFGEAVTAVVVLEPGAKVSEAEIIARLRGRLANYKLPKRVIVADALPRNAMAKVQKSILREEYSKLFA